MFLQTAAYPGPAWASVLWGLWLASKTQALLPARLLPAELTAPGQNDCCHSAASFKSTNSPTSSRVDAQVYRRPSVFCGKVLFRVKTWTAAHLLALNIELRRKPRHPPLGLSTLDLTRSRETWKTAFHKRLLISPSSCMQTRNQWFLRARSRGRTWCFQVLCLCGRCCVGGYTRDRTGLETRCAKRHPLVPTRPHCPFGFEWNPRPAGLSAPSQCRLQV